MKIKYHVFVAAKANKAIVGFSHLKNSSRFKEIKLFVKTYQVS